MTLIKDITLVILTGCLVLASCATSAPAQQLASETLGLLDKLDKDGTAITQADRRTERLRAAIIGTQLQNLDMEEQKFRLEHEAGLAVKNPKEILIKTAQDIVGENGKKLRMQNSSSYDPDAILASYPEAPSPIASYKAAKKPLKKIAKKTPSHEALLSSAQLIRDMSKAVADAREEADKKETDAKNAIQDTLEDRGTE